MSRSEDLLSMVEERRGLVAQIESLDERIAALKIEIDGAPSKAGRANGKGPKKNAPARSNGKASSRGPNRLTTELVAKVHAMGDSTTAEALAAELGIERGAAYRRLDRLVQGGMATKDGDRFVLVPNATQPAAEGDGAPAH